MARVGTIDDDIGITKAVVLVRGLRQPLTLTGALINTAVKDGRSFHMIQMKMTRLCEVI